MHQKKLFIKSSKCHEYSYQYVTAVRIDALTKVHSLGNQELPNLSVTQSVSTIALVLFGLS